MRFLLLVSVLMNLTSLSVYARKPAVEDFVGVEHKDYSPTSKGTEVLYNFNKNVQVNEQSRASSLFAYLFIGAFMILPFVMWFALTSTFSSPQKKNIVRVTRFEKDLEESNVEYLKDFRKEEKDKKEAS